MPRYAVAMHAHTRTAAVLAAAASFAALPACQGRLNDRNTIGGSVSLPSITPDAPIPTVASQDARTTGLDRADWPTTTFLVPVDGTVHGPDWKTTVSFAEKSRRQKGLYPTPDSALELTDAKGAQAIEGVAAPFIALLDVGLMPIRFFTAPPPTMRQSPERIYQRSEQTGWRSAPAAETDPVEFIETAPGTTSDDMPAVQWTPPAQRTGGRDVQEIDR